MSATVTSSVPTFRYDFVTISLHWLTAFVVAAQWAIGQALAFIPRDAGKEDVLSVHIVLGVGLLGLLVVRLLWSRLPWVVQPPRQGLGDLVARGLQHLLGVLLLATILLGLLNAAVHGGSVFTWITLPPLGGGSKEMKHFVGELHEWAANALLAVAALHALAALAHHYVLRDDVLRRMTLR